MSLGREEALFETGKEVLQEELWWERVRVTEFLWFLE